MVKRRDILKLGVAAIAANVLPRPAFAQNKMMQRKIPKSGEPIPAVGIGTSDVFDVGAGADERAPIKEVLQRFVKLGGRVVDSSPMYGRAETVVGDVAQELGVAKSLFIATKVWTRGKDAGAEQIQTSMRRLKAPTIDLMQVHNLVDLETQLMTLRDLKQQQKIRYLGVTHYTAGSHRELEDLVRKENLDFVQFNYSIATRDAEQRLLPVCAETRTATLINRPFEDGALFSQVKGKPLPDWAKEIDCESWAQFFLKFILSQPAVTCVIPATAKWKHLEDNMRAGYGKLPDAKMRERMAQHLQRL
jgi:aryl-alcohol dehydrogenase-like predicted oxidoreductase